MKALNGLAYVVALVISAGEIARFWGDTRLFPMALDEGLVAAGLVYAAWRSRGGDGRLHLAAWGAFCGLTLVLLVETAGHQIHGPAKAAGPLYLAALSFMLIVAGWALWRALNLAEGETGRLDRIDGVEREPKDQ